ncbi:hypothetical protein FHT80_005803 [Rhizobium sp. BK226]|uniref:hypothetical protein n=1 Tax=Rhizobium sp. BK226 TaxID=2587075 RepID=UPI00160C81DF|nr:hypothetical protein [Rhizobium sp. BK226]MBB4116429.1 hypothetical protein [Rhizobium sp. BK226]
MNDLIAEYRTKFSIDGKTTKYDFISFWGWAYHNVDTPLLRGVLVEYLIVNFLIDHACRVVGPRIRLLTYDEPTQADLEKSLNPFYSYQPHGDLFDLQLHWGVTIEIKSTYNVETGSLKKTQWWGPINRADNGPSSSRHNITYSRKFLFLTGAWTETRKASPNCLP